MNSCFNRLASLLLLLFFSASSFALASPALRQWAEECAELKPEEKRPYLDFVEAYLAYKNWQYSESELLLRAGRYLNAYRQLEVLIHKIGGAAAQLMVLRRLAEDSAGGPYSLGTTSYGVELSSGLCSVGGSVGLGLGVREALGFYVQPCLTLSTSHGFVYGAGIGLTRWEEHHDAKQAGSEDSAGDVCHYQVCSDEEQRALGQVSVFGLSTGEANDSPYKQQPHFTKKSTYLGGLFYLNFSETVRHLPLGPKSRFLSWRWRSLQWLNKREQELLVSLRNLDLRHAEQLIPEYIYEAYKLYTSLKFRGNIPQELRDYPLPDLASLYCLAGR